MERQKTLPVEYWGVFVEVVPIHRAQLLTYLKLTGLHLGLLLNFNVSSFRDGGITRLVRDFPAADPSA